MQDLPGDLRVYNCALKLVFDKQTHTVQDRWANIFITPPYVDVFIISLGANSPKVKFCSYSVIGISTITLLGDIPQCDIGLNALVEMNKCKLMIMTLCSWLFLRFAGSSPCIHETQSGQEQVCQKGEC